MRYIPNTPEDRRAMLDAIGRRALDDLFSDIPEAVRRRFRPLGLPERSESEVAAAVEGLAARNRGSSAVSFLGGGVYDHYVPSIVAHLTSRSEFYTAYTPYQPEISQGTLTAMFEFQTMVCELTGMEIANASMYDGATAAAEAVLMAERVRGAGRVAIARNLFPHVKRVIRTYAWAAGVEVEELPYGADGRTEFVSVPDGVSAIVVQSPNAFGGIEDLSGVKDRIGDAWLIVSVHPLSLGILSPPGRFGADVVVGEGQPLGLAAGYGGPLLGLFATRHRYLRQMPGRVAGRTVDADGNVGYTMAAQTREQHIRRERATSNICTNSALCALAATVYLAAVGATGLRRIAELNMERAHDLAQRVARLDGYSLRFDAPFFNEFVVTVPTDPAALRTHLSSAGFSVGDPAEIAELGVERALRFAVTERRTVEELDRLVDAMEEAA